MEIQFSASEQFYGTSNHQVDTDGRVVIPRGPMRDRLEMRCILTKGLDGSIWVMKQMIYDALVSAWNKQLAAADARSRNLNRFFFGSKQLGEVDRQGRLLLGNDLRNWAGIEENAVIVGAGDHIEIWSPERWAEEQSNVNYDELQSWIDAFIGVSKLPAEAAPAA